MEEDVTQHQAHIFRVLSQDLLNQWKEGTAGFAGRIEELNNGYWRSSGTDNWRMEAHQGAGCRGSWRSFFACRISIINECRSSEAERSKNADDEDDCTSAHREDLRRMRTRRAAIRVNAPSESSGSGMLPKIIMSALEHDGPAPQGLMLSGMIPR